MHYVEAPTKLAAGSMPVGKLVGFASGGSPFKFITYSGRIGEPMPQFVAEHAV